MPDTGQKTFLYLWVLDDLTIPLWGKNEAASLAQQVAAATELAETWWSWNG